jgi:hypothetical protein
MGTNPVVDARDLVAELFAQARWAVLNGSMRPSAGSDLKIMVLLPDGDPRATRNDARRFRGRPVELYLHDERSLDRQIAWELGARKPFLQYIITSGATIAGSPFEWRQRREAAVSGSSSPAGRRPGRGTLPCQKASRRRYIAVLTGLKKGSLRPVKNVSCRRPRR